MSKLLQKIRNGTDNAVKLFSKGGAGHQIFRKIANSVKDQRPLTDMISKNLREASIPLAAYNPTIGGLAYSASQAIPRISQGIEDKAREFQHTYNPKRRKPNSLERPARADPIGSTLFV